MKEIGSRHGLQVVPVGEAMLSDLQVRPDYAVQVNDAICGYIEIKKPGLGADAPALAGKRNRRQWARLSNLPNLIYTDGMSWARCETGVPKGGLAADWRQLLFPTADDGEFADGYAQTVTFGLLYARSFGFGFGVTTRSVI